MRLWLGNSKNNNNNNNIEKNFFELSPVRYGKKIML